MLESRARSVLCSLSLYHPRDERARGASRETGEETRRCSNAAAAVFAFVVVVVDDDREKNATV